MWHTPLTAVRHAIRPLLDRPDRPDLPDLPDLPGMRGLALWAGRAGRAGRALQSFMPGAGRPAHRPPRRTRVVAAQVSEAVAELPLEPERALGCGWFDSSHDLRAGLQVQEHASADAVAQELPVEFWLRLHLAEWRGQPSA